MPEREPPVYRSAPEPPTFTTPTSESAQALRERAQARAQAKAPQEPENIGNLSPEAARSILHELRVHQIELELQNEELRRTQVELEASRARYFDLYDVAPVGYLTIGEKGLVLEANLTVAGLLGVTRSALVKQPWTRFILPDDQDIYLRHRKLVLSRSAPQTCELRLLRGGEWFWARLEARVVLAADGVPTARTVLSDITERKRAEEALSASEAWHRILFENASEALVTLAPPEWHFTSANAAALALFGAENKAQLSTQALWSYSPERQPDGRLSKEKAAAMIAAAMHRGSHTFNWACQRAAGQAFSATVVLVRMEANGASLLQATLRDESEAQRQQMVLAQTERLASMGMLAASVGHEINNPLAYVLSNVEGLSKSLLELAGAAERCRPALRRAVGEATFATLVGRDAALLEAAPLRDAAERAREALDGAQRIKRISKVLNDFSRIDTLELSRVDVEHALESAISIASNELKFRATLVRDFSRVPCVWASESKLAQVFLNLLINASHAMADVDKVQRITVRTWAEADSVFTEVKDTGKGIDAADLAHIFDPFFSTKPLGWGSGLGLTICRNILGEFNGSIRVESQVGVGSSFVVQLPALEAVAPAVPAVQSIPAAPRPTPALHGRILVVDDEVMLCLMMKRLLLHHDVVTAASGKAAQAILERDQNFDLILCDLMMPEMSGMDLHRWLQRRYPTLARHLVFVTGGAFGPVAHDYLVDTGIAKIDKPFDNDVFIRIVSERLIASKSDPPPGDPAAESLRR